MNRIYSYFILFSFVALSTISCAQVASDSDLNNITNTATGSASPIFSTATPFVNPLTEAKARINKKMFGTLVTPQNSPVKPEHFRGYHTGVDFEVLPSEENSGVTVMAICSGKIVRRNWTSGYGGLVVEVCSLNKQPITVIYGHLKLTSVSAAVGQTIPAGEKLGILGEGYSTETDGERKHLHLGIHQGTAINILGYVQKKSDLIGWIDFSQYLK